MWGWEIDFIHKFEMVDSLINNFFSFASSTLKGTAIGMDGTEEEDGGEAAHSWAKVEILDERNRSLHYHPGERIRAKISIFARKRNWVHYGIYATLEGAIYYARSTSLSGASLFEALAASSGPGAHRLFEPPKIEVAAPEEPIPFGLTERFVEFVIPEHFFVFSHGLAEKNFDEEQEGGGGGGGALAPIPETFHGTTFQIRYAIVVKIKRAIHKGPLTASSEVIVRRPRERDDDDDDDDVKKTTSTIAQSMEVERRRRQILTFGLCDGLLVKINSHREGTARLTLRLNSPARGRFVVGARTGEVIVSIDVRVVRIESVYVDEELESIQRTKLGQIRVYTNEGAADEEGDEFHFTFTPFPRLEVCPSVIDLQRAGGMSFSTEFQLAFEIASVAARGGRNSGEDEEEEQQQLLLAAEQHHMTRLVDVIFVR